MTLQSAHETTTKVNVASIMAKNPQKDLKSSLSILATLIHAVIVSSKLAPKRKFNTVT